MPNPLCQNCRCLDFEQIFNNTRIPKTGIEILEVGKRALSKRKAVCNMCRFFHQLRPDYTKNFTLHVRLFTCVEEGYHYDSVQKTYSKVISDVPQQPFFCVLRKHARLSYDYNVEGEVKSAGIGCYIPHGSPTTFQLSSVDAASINWEAITCQLEHCSQQHSICRQKEAASSRLPYVFLIDCATGNIVKGSLSDQFLALSYVWGPQKGPLELSSAGYFSLQNVPLTVRDAAKAVLELGRRYLWVDRYCINQQDESERKMMIDNMDLIYESADATLIALHGENDQSGLPGVSTLSRATQPVFDTGIGHLIYSFPAITSLVESSHWNTRGWTYQEARVSRRCLFFSRYQVYLVCRHSTWSESVPFDPITNSTTKLLNSQKLDSTLFGVDRYRGWWRDRLEYSKRNLTRETDKLDAFRGILHRSSFITLWGVPIIPEKSDINPNVGFSLGLLWTKRPTWEGKSYVRTRQKFSSCRRSGFPTWNWTSLNADICQDAFGTQSKYGQYLDGTAVCFPENEANIQFWCLVAGCRLSLQDAITMTDSPILPEYSRELLVEGEFIRVRRNSNGGCFLFDEWRYFEQDLFFEKAVFQNASNENNVETEVEALVLIYWADAQRRSGTMRFVLIVVGLLTQYRDEFRCDLIQNLPRIRKRFILQ
ncbi:heterokaryon incompatibility domain containing protein [Hyaloscypha variabilis]